MRQRFQISVSLTCLALIFRGAGYARGVSASVRRTCTRSTSRSTVTPSGMELVSFSVQNYRSIAKASRIEVGRFTVLVGPNNEGKSNVLRALVTAMEVLKTGSRQVAGKGVRIHLPLSYRRNPQYDWEEDFPINPEAPRGTSVASRNFMWSATYLLCGGERYVALTLIGEPATWQSIFSLAARRQ
jgi:AAA ATPase domain